jgi:CheY-like chemotaxis protein
MSDDNKIKVVIVDDHNVVRSGLGAFMMIYDDLELIGEASNGKEAVEICSKLNPDVVLMDLIMPEMDGADATKEIREKYGNDTVNKSNNKFKGMTPEQYEEVTRISAELMETLQAAFESGDPAGELAQKAADLHRQWLCYFWDSYSKEAHAGLGQMYVDDPRFTAYYDEKQPGTAAFLRDAILIYTGMKNNV